MPDDYMTVTEAREMLGVTRSKMTSWIHDGVLPTVEDPFDKRVKLVRREDVDRLLRMRRGRDGESPKTDAVAA